MLLKYFNNKKESVRKFVISRIEGGLGNQMFQYAIGRNLSKKAGADLILDTSFYENHSRNDKAIKRSLELDRYNIKYIVLKDIIKGQHRLRKLFVAKRTTKKILCWLFGIKLMIESGQEYDSRIESINAPCYISGYWQTEKYFKNIRKELVEEFSLKNDLGNKAKFYLDQIQRSSNAVSLHVRRGDYISNPIYRKCEMSYYINAMDIIQSKYSDVDIFIFSDDSNWVMQNMKFVGKTHIVQNTSSFEDIYLMSKCKHNVLANSSFSWWGAWLNTYDLRITVAPKLWFNNEFSSSDICPEEWIKI